MQNKNDMWKQYNKYVNDHTANDIVSTWPVNPSWLDLLSRDVIQKVPVRMNIY